jgi:cyclic pyranopterin phosphate synthase
MFSHLDASDRPAMVDVSDKAPTRREATARALVRLPPEVSVHFRDGEIRSKKGPVFQTAILAGTMACKKTADLIPLCHPLPLDSIQIRIAMEDGDAAAIECTVSCHGRTGVEMEALTGASVAALTLYDMCKALSHAIVISEIRLVEKTGGKSDFRASVPGGALSGRGQDALAAESSHEGRAPSAGRDPAD